MDIAYFLKQRTAFIRQFYDVASFPFIERKRKIEAKEEPFIPPYSEDEEPPFLEEWIEADESFHVLGYSCLSMLSAALQLYFKTWEIQFNIPDINLFKSEFKKGWFNGYKAYFAHHMGIRFEEAPVDLSIIEQIVLARNQIQHPEDITSHIVRYSGSDIKKIPNIYFVNELEQIPYEGIDESEKSWLFPPTLHVTREKLSAVIAEVDKLVDWMELQIKTKVYMR
jgi:hypothetical protein